VWNSIVLSGKNLGSFANILKICSKVETPDASSSAPGALPLAPPLAIESS